MQKRMLVGWDGSKQSKNALKYAIDEAKDKKIQNITAVYIKEEKSKRIKEMLEDYRIKIDKKILKKKDTFVEALTEEARSLGKEQGIEVETHIINDNLGPAVDIVKFAEKNGFHHIIVGSHGRSGIFKMALGSVAEEIVEKGHCVVTIVRCDWISETKP